MVFKASQFNYPAQFDNGKKYLFNSLNISVIRIPDNIEPIVNELLSIDGIDINELPDPLHPLTNMLIEGGFIIPEEIDEKQKIEERYLNQPGDNILSLTIVPSLNCNLACVYCYQEHDKSKMDLATADKLLVEIDNLIKRLNPEGVEVDWYGGEPLLATKIVEYLSNGLMKISERNDVTYNATITTNATLINESNVKILQNAEIDELQITLDGPPSIHNINRPYLNGKPSFDAVLKGIEIALEHFDVNLRININKDTLENSFELLNILKSKELFNKPKELRPYIAMIGPLSYTCSHTARDTMPLEEFFNYVLKFQKEVIKQLPNTDLKRILEFPKVLNRACGAQSKYSLCIHPSGRVFKCGLEVHDLDLGGDFIWEDFENHKNYKKWMSVNPLNIDECKDCQFLPICMGGCAKYNFKEGDFYEKEACIYWNNYLKHIIKQYVEVQEELPS